MHRYVGENSLYQSCVKQIQGVQGMKGSPSYQACLPVHHQQLHFTSLTETKKGKKPPLTTTYFIIDDSSHDLYSTQRRDVNTSVQT